MKFRGILKLICICCLLSIVSFGQKQNISKEEFNKVRQAAYQTAKSKARRLVIWSTRSIEDVVQSSDEYLHEYELPDKYHYIHTGSNGNKEFRLELFQIGNIYTCRTGDSEWTQSIEWCSDDINQPGTGSDLSSSATVETVTWNDGTAKLYSQSGKLQNFTNSGMKARYSNCAHKFWVNNDGLILKEESWRNSEDPKELQITQTDTYEYIPNLKIEAPIK